ncbi:MAG TPA: OmpA family protein [Steroidobacteraceae bacterium]|nr:OmpA family protein [Steroidobacteraceae bacterium]
MALVGFLFDRSNGDPASAVPGAAGDAAAPAPTTVLARVYFDRGRSALDADDRATLAGIATLARESGASLTLTGYADATGDKWRNISLARDRTTVVRISLLTHGVPESRLIARRPASVTGSGTDAEARRVEISTTP